MNQWIIQNQANIIISAVILCIVALITVNLIKKKKSGKAAGCSSCSGCPNSGICGRMVEVPIRVKSEE
jgi:hypothetical protein